MQKYLTSMASLRMRRSSIVTFLICIIFSTLFSACGSDGTNGIAVTGLVGDDPIVGAQVNAYGPFDDEAPNDPVLGTGVTDNNGRDTLTVTPPPPYRITATNGSMKGLPFPGVFTAFCKTADHCNASPYTSALNTLMVEEGKSYEETTYLLARILNVDYDPFLHEMETGQTIPAASFNLAAARAALTTKDAIADWIGKLAALAAQTSAVVPAGVNLALRVPASDPLMRKGPYLMLTGKNSEMRVLWEPVPDAPVTGADLSWGPVGAAMKTTPAQATDFLYQSKITDLTPGTLYDYTVTLKGTSSGLPKSYGGSFKTPPAADAGAVSFYAYGDTRSNTLTHNNVVSGISNDMNTPGFREQRQTFVFHVGDFVHDGNQPSYWNSEYFVTGSDYVGKQTFLSTFPIAASVGNHEFWSKAKNACGDPNSSGDTFRKFWPSDLYQKSPDDTKHYFYYSMDYGPVHFAVLDLYTADYTIGSAQYQWLANDLATTTKTWKVVALHVPFYDASGSKSGAGCNINDTYKKLQANIQPLLEKYGVQLVLQGHQHYYSRSTINNVTYLLVGGGGPLSPLNTVNGVPTAQLPANSAPIGIYGGIYQFARIDADSSAMTVSIIEVKNAVPTTANIAPSNSPFEQIKITSTGIATVNAATVK
jgi:hypothetical protein